MKIIEIEAPSENDGVLTVEGPGGRVDIENFPRAEIETIWQN